MNKTILAALFILAGLAVPIFKDSLGKNDTMIMLAFFLFGILLILSGRVKKNEADEYYKYTLAFENIRLFDVNGRAVLKSGQQLYVQAYQGEKKEDVHLLTADGDFVAVLPQEQRAAVLYKIEKHSPVLVYIRGVKAHGTESYSIDVELMC